MGGAVRDLLLGKKNPDWDFTTNAKPEEVTKLFKKVIPTGIKFGTVTVLIKKVPYEVTTYRSDESYIDGRHPENVKFTTSLEEDLKRRDFTINALAYDPIEDKLVDLFDGQKDLKDKLIRAVGNPLERFKEDGLRSIRACRFATKLGFKIEKETFAAISKTLSVTKKVAFERVHDELIKMLGANQPSIGIELMRKAGLLKLFIPELEKGIKVRQPKPYHKYDVYYHNLACMDAAPKDQPIIPLAALLHDVEKPKCKDGMKFYGHDQKSAETAVKILRRLKFSNADVEKVRLLVANHMFHYTPKWTDAAVRRFIRKVGLESIEELFTLRIADVAAMAKSPGTKYLPVLRRRIKKILARDNALHLKDLAIDGNDVMKTLNIKPGPEVGKILNQLLEKVLDEPSLNNKKTLTEALRPSFPKTCL